MKTFLNLTVHLFRTIFNAITFHDNENHATDPHYLWWNMTSTYITTASNYSDLNTYGYFPSPSFCYFFLLGCRANSSPSATAM